MRPAVIVSVALVLATTLVVTQLPAQDAVEFLRQEWARQHPVATPVQPPAISEDLTMRPKLTIRPYSRRPLAERSTSAQAVCVRMCDGYYFPAPDDNGPGESCESMCPGAPVEVYRLAGESIEQAVSRHGKRYAALPAAFSYRKGLRPDCTCGQQAATALERLRHDATLAPGDIVVTEDGVHVFVGGSRPPHPDRNFVPYRQAGGLSRQTRNYLAQIDRPYRRHGEDVDANEAASARAEADVIPPRWRRRRR